MMTVHSSTSSHDFRARRILRYIIKDPKTKQTKDIDDAKIVDVQCGQHHAVALDDQGRWVDELFPYLLLLALWRLLLTFTEQSLSTVEAADS